MKPTRKNGNKVMYVVFDTNFYRTLVSRRTTQEVKELMCAIQVAEDKKGITPMQSATVAQELLSHLLDAGNGTNCTNACIALYLHTGNRKEFRMIPLPDVQIAKMVFGVDWEERIKTQEACGLIMSELAATEDVASVIAKYRNELEQIKHYIADVEESLASGVENIFKAYDPNYKMGDLPFGENKNLRRRFLDYIDSSGFEWDTVLALLISIAMRLHQQFYKLPQIENVLINARQVPIFYSAAMAFRKMYFKKFTSSAYDIRKDNHANYIWDEYILTSLGNFIQKEAIGIVTTDTDMNTTMQNFNHKLKIETLEQYSAYLGIDLIKDNQK